jgi:alpha-L-rhamnosidase
MNNLHKLLLLSELCNYKITKYMKTRFTGLFITALELSLTAFLIISCSDKNELKVTNLRCEYLENPLGMDVAQPRFCWNIVSSKRAVTQSAYRIIVTDDLDLIKNESGNIWDSEKIPSAQMANIVYRGKPLQSDKTYYWSVEIWNGKGEKSSWGKTAFFHTGLFDPADWNASWIASPDTNMEAPLFRKDFKIEKKIEKAFAYVTAAGFYELYINEKKTGDHLLDPEITDYSKRVLYSTYDITDQLKEGSNAAGIILGNGAYRFKKVPGRFVYNSRDVGVPRVLMQINILYNDGSAQSVVTDGSWKFAQSPVTYNSLSAGEDYDARLERKGWASAGFKDSDWQNTEVVKGPGGIIRSQLIPAIRVIQTIQPVMKTSPSPEVILYDLGQNIPGWWRLTVKGNEGLRLRIQAAEQLNDSLFAKPLEPGDRLSNKQKYQKGVWNDYILKGDGTEIYEPRFFYTGFRYIQVTVDKPSDLKSLFIEGRVVHTALERNGEFETSDSLLNRIHRATIWSQIGNTVGYPTDCPQREKGGYTGDGQLIAETSIHDFQMSAFYTKWLNDMKDAQEDNGRIPNTAPTLVGGMGGGIAWGSAYILLPWWMYQYYNDTRVIEEHYPAMKKYIDYLHNLARTDKDPKEKYIINDFMTYWYSLGEWCAPGKKNDCPNHPVVNTCYYYYDVKTLSQIAELLGHIDDAERYRALADTIKTEFNKKFFNPVTNLFGTDSTYQTYQLLALATGIAPEEKTEGIFKTITDDITITRQGHLYTGIIGTKYLWPVLVHNGRADLAYSITKMETYPSFGFWIKKGETTLIEEWSGKGSHNHEMFGTVDEFFYKYLAGINAPTDNTTSPGYKHIFIQPYIPENLSHAGASVNTIAGKIESFWTKASGKLVLKVVIPVNSDASINIPLMDLKNISVTESGKTIWTNGAFTAGVEAVNSVEINKSFLVISTGSGTYNLEVTGK